MSKIIEGRILAIHRDRALVIIFWLHEATIIGRQLRTKRVSFPALGIMVIQDYLCNGANTPVLNPYSHESNTSGSRRYP